MPIITKRKVSNGVTARLEKVWDVWENCHEIGVMTGKTHVCVKVNETFARCQVKDYVQIFLGLYSGTKIAIIFVRAVFLGGNAQFDSADAHNMRFCIIVFINPINNQNYGNK